eukprot:SAG31_NODE_28165_length_414_cov_1.285714_1_plen_28_part_10
MPQSQNNQTGHRVWLLKVPEQVGHAWIV